MGDRLLWGAINVTGDASAAVTVRFFDQRIIITPNFTLKNILYDVPDDIRALVDGPKF